MMYVTIGDGRNHMEQEGARIAHRLDIGRKSAKQPASFSETTRQERDERHYFWNG